MRISDWSSAVCSSDLGLDVLSDVLLAGRLTGAFYVDIHAQAPWVAESPPVAAICGSVMPDFEHVICFHILMEGACWAQLADESLPAIRLGVGDAVIFAGGDAHYMGTERGKRSVPNLDIYYRPTDATLPFVFNEFGGDGAQTRFRSEEHTSELQSLMRISYAVFCLKK